MAAARAAAGDKRWAAVAAAAPARAPAGVLGTGPNPSNLQSQSQRGAFAQGNKPVPPASNAWDSSLLLSIKNGGSGLSCNINVRPSSRGSSGSSTSGSDLLDSPLASGRSSHPLSADLLPSHNSATATSRPQSTRSRSGSLQYPHFQTCFSGVLKAPLRTTAKRGPTSHGNVFTLNADDFPVLVSKNSEFNSKSGVDPLPTSNFPLEAQQAQLHGTQASDICMTPPCLDFWHPPPDHPPDRDETWHSGAASYVPCKAADTNGTFPVDSFTYNCQSLHNEGGEASYDSGHGGYHPENRESCYADMQTEACVISQPHGTLGEVKESHADILEKQPAIKKDLVLLEKIKCLNIKARNLRARNISEISSCRESKVDHPRSINTNTVYIANANSAITNDIVSAYDRVNSVSDNSYFVPNVPSDVFSNHAIIDLSEGHVTELTEDRKPGKAADYHVCGGGNTLRNWLDSSSKDSASIFGGSGWEEQSTVDSLPVSVTNTCQDEPFPGNYYIYGGGNTSINWLDSSSTGSASIFGGSGWEEQSAVDSLPASVTNTFQDEPFPGNDSQWVHVRAANDTPNFLDHEIQHSRSGEAKSIGKLDVNRHLFVKSQKSNVAALEENKISRKQVDGDIDTTKHDTSTSDTCTGDHNVLLTNGVKNTGISISSALVSDSTGVNRGPSAEKTDIKMVECISQKSPARSHDTSGLNHLLVESRRRPAHSQDRVLKERSNIIESTEHNANIAGIPMDPQIAEAKPYLDPSSQNKNRKPVSPRVLGSRVYCGSIILGDGSLASANQERKTVAQEVYDTVHGCASPQQSKHSRKNQHGVRDVKDPHGNDSIMRTPFEEPSKKEQSEAVRLHGTAIPAPTQPSGNQNTVQENVVPSKKSEMAHKPLSKGLHQQILKQMLPAENHIASSTSKLEALGTSAAAKKTEVETETEKGDKETNGHVESSMPCWNEEGTNGLASVAPNLTEPEANSLVLKVMQELSDQLQETEKQFVSKNPDATENRLQPTQTVPLPGKTPKKHRTSLIQRHHYVDSQRNVWSNHAANSYMDDAGRIHRFYRRAARPTAHWLPKPIPLPQNNALNDTVSEWTWDADEGILISDMCDSQGFSATAVDSRGEVTQNVDWGGREANLQGGQGERDLAYREFNPGAEHQRGLGHQPVNPSLHHHAQHDDRRRHLRGGDGRGTGVYFKRDRDAGRRPDNANWVAGGTVGWHSEYQQEPAWSSDVAGGWGQGRPAPNWEGAYMNRGYYL
ncbi:hypothetical protein ACP4OV_002078 [Aristida adscensionis]